MHPTFLKITQALFFSIIYLPAVTFPQGTSGSADDFIRKQELDRAQEIERIRQQELDKAYSKRLESTPASPTKSLPTVDPKASDSFQVDKFIFFISGEKKIPRQLSFLKKAAKRELIRYANKQTLEALIGRLTVQLYTRGFVTTLLHLPEQDFKNGIVRIEIIPGHINKLISEDPKFQRSFQMILPRLKGRLLNYRELENGIDSMERLNSHKAEFQIAPSTKNSHSDIICKMSHSKRWLRTVSFDDSYTKNLGEYTLRGNYSYDNPFGFADFFSINASTALSAPSHVKRRGHGFTYEIPLAGVLTRFGANWNYSSLPIGVNKTASETKSLGLNLDGIIKGYRNKYFKSEFGFTLSNYLSRKFLGGVEEPVSRRKTTSLSLRYNATWFIGRASLNTTLSGKWALPWFNSDQDASNNLNTDPTYEFKIYNFNLVYTNRGNLTKAQPFTWTTVINVQYTDDILYNSEQFSIGSRYSVRGYGDEFSVSAEKGFFVRNEIALPLKPVLKVNPTLYFGVDYGKVTGYSDRYNDDNELAGAFVGMRASWKRINANITWAEPLLGELSRNELGDRLAMNFSYSF